MASGFALDGDPQESEFSWRERFAVWSRAQGARTRWTLYLLSATGLVLWDPLQLPWFVARQVLILHVAASMVLFPLFVIPFWVTHRGLLRFSHNPFQRTTGRIIDLFLSVVLVSGIALVVLGNPGNTIGKVAFWSHLLVAVPLILSLALHLMRRVGGTRTIAVLWAQIRSNHD
jgi:hypothetical protein